MHQLLSALISRTLIVLFRYQNDVSFPPVGFHWRSSLFHEPTHIYMYMDSTNIKLLKTPTKDGLVSELSPLSDCTHGAHWCYCHLRRFTLKIITFAVTTSSAWPTYNELVIWTLIHRSCNPALEDLRQMGREIRYVECLDASECL